jgi:hypothetical protein
MGFLRKPNLAWWKRQRIDITDEEDIASSSRRYSLLTVDQSKAPEATP